MQYFILSWISPRGINKVSIIIISTVQQHFIYLQSSGSSHINTSRVLLLKRTGRYQTSFKSTQNRFTAVKQQHPRFIRHRFTISVVNKAGKIHLKRKRRGKNRAAADTIIICSQRLGLLRRHYHRDRRLSAEYTRSTNTSRIKRT